MMVVLAAVAVGLAANAQKQRSRPRIEDSFFVIMASYSPNAASGTA